jgi:hypothetical protein
MTIVMDDPTTYLKRDKDVNVIAVGPTTPIIQEICLQYGVMIQVVVPGTGNGVQAVTTVAKATTVLGLFPANTPWFIVPGVLNDPRTEQMIRAFYGPPKTMAVALGVVTDGIAWRPDKYRVSP